MTMEIVRKHFTFTSLEIDFLLNDLTIVDIISFRR